MAHSDAAYKPRLPTLRSVREACGTAASECTKIAVPAGRTWMSGTPGRCPGSSRACPVSSELPYIYPPFFLS